jgi:hypothetical protein
VGGHYQSQRTTTSPAASRDYSGTLTVDAEIEVFQLQRAARGSPALQSIPIFRQVDFNPADDVEDSGSNQMPGRSCAANAGSFACERRIELFQLHESPSRAKPGTRGLSVGRVLGSATQRRRRPRNFWIMLEA